MSSATEKTVTVLVGVAAIAVAASLVRREFFPARRQLIVATRTSTAVRDWQLLLPAARRWGDSSARVKVIEFADLECPACRDMHPTLRAIKEKHGPKVALHFIHLPIPRHRFARPAARAAECAEPYGKFHEFVGAIYTEQDSLGFKPWTAFAADVGIRDTVAFKRCAADRAPVPRIDQGVALAARFGVDRTPTVIVNGWMYGSPPSLEELDRIVADILAGKDPLKAEGRR